MSGSAAPKVPTGSRLVLGRRSGDARCPSGSGRAPVRPSSRGCRHPSSRRRVYSRRAWLSRQNDVQVIGCPAPLLAGRSQGENRAAKVTTAERPCTREGAKKQLPTRGTGVDAQQDSHPVEIRSGPCYSTHCRTMGSRRNHALGGKEEVGRAGLEPAKAVPADLQSAPFAARDTDPRCTALSSTVRAARTTRNPEPAMGFEPMTY